jgi:heme/copper-type cytochrome/quinol oxidase subunit 2
LKRILILLSLVASLLILFLPLPVFRAAPRQVHIRIEASMFNFSPNQIRVNPGDTVTVELVSTDVVHGFSLDGYDFELHADPGQSVSGTFVADQPGMFRFRCSIACGNLHPFMIGKFQVGTNPWLLRGGLLLGLATIIGLWTLRPSSGRSNGSA